MRKIRGTVLGFFIFHIPDILVSIYLIYVFYNYNKLGSNVLYYVIFGVLTFIFLRALMILLGSKYFYVNRVNKIQDVISEFKKGRFLTKTDNITGNDKFSRALKGLVEVGKHFENIVSTQRNEINRFHELYNSLVFSINSFFIVLDMDGKAIFANDGFYNKFQLEHDDIIGKRIDDILYLSNERINGGISQVKATGKSVFLEKTHLLSINKVSIIADIKISNIVIRGRNQIILIFEDVTSKLKKDYQISYINSIAESIQKSIEIERVLHTILTGVISGSGLGFNRAILFLVEDDKYLAGKMVAGLDSFEDTVDIQSNANGVLKRDSLQIEDEVNAYLINKVKNTRFSLEENNIFTNSLKKREKIHIYDSNIDERIDNEIREFFDVKEFVIVPLIAVNKTIGLIIVDNKFSQAPITNDSIELLSIFAAQAALSIESHNSLMLVKREIEMIGKRQNLIVKSEKMAAVGRIAAHIAHEIRNPLVTMGGYARRIIQQSKDNAKLNKNIGKAATIILNESERLEKILSNVMDFTRPSKYIKEFNNINEIVDDTVNLLTNLFLERKIEVNLDLNDDIPLLQTDFNQMKQAMLNLLQNSIDAIKDGGQVEVVTENRDIYVAIRIANNGASIDEEDPNIIFEPFFTTKETGIGLGLANVKKIIIDHKGSIGVRNRDVCGVEFEIRLPVPVPI